MQLAQILQHLGDRQKKCRDIFLHRILQHLVIHVIISVA
jgi:hypothetical protein